jgi:hypothetical protein
MAGIMGVLYGYLVAMLKPIFYERSNPGPGLHDVRGDHLHTLAIAGLWGIYATIYFLRTGEETERTVLIEARTSTT